MATDSGCNSTTSNTMMSSTDTPVMSTSLLCAVCGQKYRRPHLLSCLHVFCLACLQDECQGNSPQEFNCPLCVVSAKEKTDKPQQCSRTARPWHSFERIEDNEELSINEEVLQARLAELPAFENRGDSFCADNQSDDSSSGSGSNSISGSDRKVSAVLDPPVTFPCSIHGDRLADTFCFKCNQLACNKCISSFHRRCQNFGDLNSAVETRRGDLEQIHGKMAGNLVACEEVRDFHETRIKELDETRTRVLIDIKRYRTELVNMILAKEKALTQQTNRLLDQMKTEATAKKDFANRVSTSLRKQLDFLDLSISVKGEGELLPLVPEMKTRVDEDAELISSQFYGDADISNGIGCDDVTFVRDEKCHETLTNHSLGKLDMANTRGLGDLANNDNDEENNGRQNKTTPDLNLTLMTSFHGGTRDDVTDPLLTDLILLANGDVILTDRDNKCVKKFNQSGQLLTRVAIDAVPSRIASVSHGRAVVSVMTKKALYFLSLFGTVRVLNTVPVKKIYSFLTSVGHGLLVAGTNQCDSIDLLSERGETLRKIFTQKPDRAIIARPLYLTPVVPHSSISLKTDHSSAISSSSSSSSKSKNSRRTSTTTTTTTTSPNGNAVNIKSPSSGSANTTTNNNTTIADAQKVVPPLGKIRDASTTSTATTASSNSLSQNLIIKNSKILSSGQPPAAPHDKNQNQNSSTTSTTSNSSKPTTAAAATSNSKTTNRRRSLQPTKHTTTTPLSSSSSLLPPQPASSIPSSSTSTKQNLLVSTTTTPSSSSSTLAATSTSNNNNLDLDILVSDSGKRAVFRMRQDGTVAFTFKSKSTTASASAPASVSASGGEEVTLDCPLGITVHESGLTLLADRDNDSILVLDQAGHCVKKVLSSADGVTRPCGLYAGRKGVVAMSQVDGMIKIFRPT